MQQETIAIIPARGGSKRCPDKNVALFKGKSMAAHTIEQALEANIFDRIIVSSDDPRVLEIASNYPVGVDNRDASLATDNAGLIDVIRYIITNYGIQDNFIIGLLQVTAPLRIIEDITNAYKIFCNSSQHNSVVSVTFNESPIQLSWSIENNILVPVLSDNLVFTTRKQDYEATYKWNDAVIFDLAKNFRNLDRNLFGKAPVPYVMPPERSISIDYKFQLKLVQMMGKYYQEF